MSRYILYNALKNTFSIFAVIHLSILFIQFLMTKDLERLNLITILHLDMFLPDSVSNNYAFVLSVGLVLFVLAVNLFILRERTHKSV